MSRMREGNQCVENISIRTSSSVGGNGKGVGERVDGVE